MFTFIDLFAGIGGFRIAMERLGGKCVFGSEIDKHARLTYARNFGEEPAGDITKIDAKDVPDHEVLCGGFPCQPFSVSGKQLGWQDARGTLFFEIMRIVAAKRPKVLFLENVKNYVTHRNGETLARTVEMMESAGYRTEWAVLNASNFGVPQARKRVYFVGIRDDIASERFVFPEGGGKSVCLRDILVDAKTAESVLIDRDDITMHEDATERLSAKARNRPVQIGVISKGGQGERIYSIHGHAITLSAHGGGAASKTGAYWVDGKIRRLHPLECKRAMGFPEAFRIDRRQAQSFKQFGNAVVVSVVQAIGKRIVTTAGLEWAGRELDWQPCAQEFVEEPKKRRKDKKAVKVEEGAGESLGRVPEAVVEPRADLRGLAAPELPLEMEPAPLEPKSRAPSLAHESLPAYRRAIDFVVWTEKLFDKLHKAGSVKKELERSSNRIPLGIVDGVGKQGCKERLKALQGAHALALECGATLDIIVGRGLRKKSDVEAGKALLLRLAGDLESLIEGMEADGDSPEGELNLGLLA